MAWFTHESNQEAEIPYLGAFVLVVVDVAVAVADVLLMVSNFNWANYESALTSGIGMKFGGSSYAREVGAMDSAKHWMAGFTSKEQAFG